MFSVKCSTMAILVVLEGVSIVGAKIVITANVLTHTRFTIVSSMYRFRHIKKKKLQI